MGKEQISIEQILITDVLTKKEQKPRSVRMSGDTNKALKQVTKDINFSQDAIVNMGILTARKVHSDLMSKKLLTAEAKFKKHK